MSVTRDTFGRAVITHVCSECVARFLGPAECRPCPANGFAHPKPVKALPLYGCEEPPDITWAIALSCLVKARTHEEAWEMAQHVVERTFPKRVVERHGWQFRPIPLETRADVVAATLGERRSL